MLFLLLALSGPPTADVTVDVIERNHVAHGLDQMIFWDFTSRHGETRKVVDWRPSHKCGELIGVRPFRLLWREDGRLVRVSSPAYQETWTEYDPEVLDRATFPMDERRGL